MMKYSGQRTNRAVVVVWLCGFFVGALVMYIWDETTPPAELAAAGASQDVAPYGMPSEKCSIPYPMQMSMTPSKKEDAFYSFLMQTNYKCRTKERVGSKGHGGWDRCADPDFQLQPPNCFVYSFGVPNSDWSFDDAMAKKGCQVISFDPRIQHARQRSATHTFVPAVVGGFFRQQNYPASWTVKTLGEWRKQFGHDKVPLDYVKIDIEDGEWRAIEAMLVEGSLRDVLQLAIEVHGKQNLDVQSMHIRATVLHALESMLGFRKFSAISHPEDTFTSRISGKEREANHELVYVNSRFTDEACEP